jgi:CRISPR-associated protein Cas2
MPGSGGKSMFVVVAYDITHDRRRLRVMKKMKGYGEHVQESVFECDVNPAVYRKLIQDLRKLIKPEEDNVRIYHLCRADAERIEEIGVGRPVQLAKEFRII